jgi:hypothetical protein
VAEINTPRVMDATWKCAAYNIRISGKGAIMPKHSGSQKGKKGSTATRSTATRSYAQKPDHVKGSGSVSDKGQKSQRIDLPEISTSKKSCGTTVLTLLLPFIAIGAYFIFRS